MAVVFVPTPAETLAHGGGGFRAHGGRDFGHGGVYFRAHGGKKPLR